MSKYALGIYLVLVGVTGLLTTALPPWITAATALAAGLVCLLEGVKASK